MTKCDIRGISSFLETVCSNLLPAPFGLGDPNGETARLVWGEDDGVSLVLGVPLDCFTGSWVLLA